MGWALVFRVIGWASQPVFEDDYFRYLWDGYRLASTGNPYGVAPAEFFGDGNVPEPLQRVLDGVNHPDIATIYGPACQWSFGAAYLIAPGQLWSWKLVVLAADLVVLALAGRRGGVRAALLYGWCPLVVFEISFNAHMDVLALAWMALAVAFAPGWARGVFGAFAIGTKFFAIVPLLFWLRPREWVVAAATLMALYAGFAEGFHLPESPGLAAMAGDWAFNSLLPAAVGHWPARVAGVAAIALIGWMCFRKHLLPESAAQLAMGAFLLSSPVLNPWYVLWLMPFAALQPTGAAFAAMAAVSISYATGLHLADPSLGLHEHPIWVRPAESILVLLGVCWDLRKRPNLRSLFRRAPNNLRDSGTS